VLSGDRFGVKAAVDACGVALDCAARLPSPSRGSQLGGAWVNSDPDELLVAALLRDAHRRRVLEHQAKVEAEKERTRARPFIVGP